MMCMRRERSVTPADGVHVVTIRVQFADGDVGLYEVFKGDEAEAERIWEAVNTVYFEEGRQVDRDSNLDITLLPLQEWDAFLRSVGAS